MIYTIGNTENYLKYFEKVNHPMKKGRDGSYPGGSVWKTFKEAAKYAKPGFSVFGVLADWDLDTVPDPDNDWHNLINNAELVRLDGK